MEKYIMAIDEGTTSTRAIPVFRVSHHGFLELSI